MGRENILEAEKWGLYGNGVVFQMSSILPKEINDIEGENQETIGDFCDYLFRSWVNGQM